MTDKAPPTGEAERRRVLFGKAVESALDGRSQAWLGAEVARATGAASPISGSAVSQWISGKTEPAPDRVFAAEKILKLRPGTLSRLLGYLPASAKDVVTVEDALDADTALSPTARGILRASYRAAVGK